MKTKTLRNKIVFLLVSSFLLTSCSIFRKYKTITTKPNHIFSNKIMGQDTSLFSFDLKIDYKTIEAKINEQFSQPITDNETGEFKKQYKAKTKNPLYNPTEWLKTKDPLYHPNKWIKIKILGKTIKTKDPLYHPNEWIKTKNPLYDPNEWIYADVVDITVGYKYEYSIEKRETIRFENIGNDILRIIIPLDITGSVGFTGEGAQLFSLDKKNVKAKIDFYVDTKISFNPNWCPLVESKISHKWISDPKIEIVGGIWLNLKLPANNVLKNKEKEIEKEIATKIECERLITEIKKWVKPSSLQLTNLSDHLYLNVNPQKFYLSDLMIDESNLNIKFATKLLTGISTKKLYNDEPYELSNLEKYAFEKNLIALTVPISIQYKTLQNILNLQLKKEGLNFSNDKAKIEVEEFEIYPSGENITIGVKLTAKIKGNILSTKGKVYLSAKPVIDNKQFELENISFSTVLDNELYPILGTIFKNKLTRFISSKTKRDLKDDFTKAENIVENKLKEQLHKVNNMDIKTEKIIFDIPYIAIQEHDFVIPVRLATGVEIKVKNIW
ncbi:hypothetical protein SY27_13635 [Flavobacterium sp. 316]|uniref:DUF4403 family protein n=1 Tax=Flavobacterium sp. 316 TaxID=1603293 RepID=UPI0005E9A1EC|nr:DUF4403 family protein [Flavobacterium sp. 316]KIX20185.1 hypothetical protein SY27_13635 [Flavobacterium sp. 316]